MDLLEEDNTLNTDPNKDYLQELVGDGKKFKTPQDLARGKYEADNYVKTLTMKLDEMRADYMKLDADYKARAKLEDLIDQLNKAPKQPLSNEQPIVNDVKMPEIDPKHIETLIDSQIKKNKILDRETDNFNKVKDKLRERFGVNYQTTLSEQIDSLGLTVDDMNALAKKSPTAFFKTLGMDQPVQTEGFQTPPRTNLRNDSFLPKGGPKRTWSYYQDLKKKDRNLYYDPKTNIQMEKDRQALGVEFEDGDFNKFG